MLHSLNILHRDLKVHFIKNKYYLSIEILYLALHNEINYELNNLIILECQRFLI